MEKKEKHKNEIYFSFNFSPLIRKNFKSFSIDITSLIADLQSNYLKEYSF